jgi:hypothetical protein
MRNVSETRVPRDVRDDGRKSRRRSTRMFDSPFEFGIIVSAALRKLFRAITAGIIMKNSAV